MENPADGGPLGFHSFHFNFIFYTLDNYSLTMDDQSAGLRLIIHSFLF